MLALRGMPAPLAGIDVRMDFSKDYIWKNFFLKLWRLEEKSKS